MVSAQAEMPWAGRTNTTRASCTDEGRGWQRSAIRGTRRHVAGLRERPAGSNHGEVGGQRMQQKLRKTPCWRAHAAQDDARGPAGDTRRGRCERARRAFPADSYEKATGGNEMQSGGKGMATDHQKDTKNAPP